MHVILMLYTCDPNVITIASFGMWVIVTGCEVGVLSKPPHFDLAVDETLLVYYSSCRQPANARMICWWCLRKERCLEMWLWDRMVECLDDTGDFV